MHGFTIHTGVVRFLALALVDVLSQNRTEIVEKYTEIVGYWHTLSGNRTEPVRCPWKSLRFLTEPLRSPYDRRKNFGPKIIIQTRMVTTLSLQCLHTVPPCRVYGLRSYVFFIFVKMKTITKL